MPTREWRELYTALDGAAVAAIHPFYTASVREFEAAGRTVVGSAPVGVDGTAAWLESIGEACGVSAKAIGAAKDAALPAIGGVLAAAPIDASLIVSGYEGSELLVARLAIECGARVGYVGTACPRTPWSAHDLQWLESRGVRVKFRASLEDDLAALEEFRPDLAIGTTPLVQAAKSRAIPALYFTNLISARPLMGVAGAGSVGQVINAALANRPRFERMKSFFEGVGEGDTAWHLEGDAGAAPRVRQAVREEAGEAGRGPLQHGEHLSGEQRHAGTRSRPRRRLLGLGLRLHRDQGIAGRHRRPGRLREPAGHLGAALHRRAAALTSCRSS